MFVACADADQHRRQRLAGHDLGRAKGRDQQLVEGALLALAGDRHGRQQQRLHHA